MEVRVAEAAQRAEVRRDEERTKRWLAAEAREEPPPAYLQLERMYKGQVKILEAAFRVSQARAREGWAEAALQEALGCGRRSMHTRARFASLPMPIREAP